MRAVSTRSTGWLLFAITALALPFPAIGPFGGFVPAVHHLVLFGATGAIAAVEGVAGPVRQILALFAINVIATLLACGLVASLLAGLIGFLPPRARTAIAWGLAAALLAASLAFPLYQTPFGRAPTANLLGLF
jgi:hypothetical protein